MHLVGLDVGTTGCKACVFDSHGTLKGYALHEYEVICTEPHMGEQDAVEVWSLTKGVLRAAVRQAGVGDIGALSLSVQGDAIIPIDRKLNPLCNAVLGMDYRSESQARACAQRFGERELFEQTGMRPHPMNSVVKMLWLKETRPAIFDKAWKITTYADYITGLLCGEPVIDYTMASRTMAFDLTLRCWSLDLLESMGLSPKLLCRAEASGTIAGSLDGKLAKEIGVPKGIPVVTGGHDQTCAALGAGVVGEGRAVISSGTAEVLSTTFGSDVDSGVLYESYYPRYIYAVPDKYFTFALNHAGGISFRWYRDNLGLREKHYALDNGVDPYGAIIERMPAGPSPVMVMPHFAGSPTPSCDLGSRAAIVGMSFSTTRHDIAKALLEGLSFELRANLERMARAGISVDELIAVGGGAKSDTWLQMRADILNRPVSTLRTREAACLGAAILGGLATGVYSSAEGALGHTCATEKTFEPDPEMVERYAERFGVYSDMYPALRGLNKRL